MWKILIAYGIPQKIVRMIKVIYDGSSCNIRLDDGLTDNFEIRTGVKQGCILSPFLFSIIIDYILSLIDDKKYGMQIGKLHLFDMDFADDIALLESSIKQLQACTDELKSYAEKVGLRFNARKCEVMGTLVSDEQITIDQDVVKTTDAFTYLGSKISKDGNCTEEIKTRIGKAGAAFGRMNKIFT